MDEIGNEVGRVLGTEDSTPLTYWFALSPGASVQLDDVVVTDRRLPSGQSVSVSGVVTQVRARHEGARFDSDVFLINDGVLPAEVVEAAEVMTTRVEPEVFVPPLPGSEVRRAADKERDEALYFDQMEHRLPIGLGRDGAPLFANLEFLDGTRGAHVNISGISGVATKTTYATFLLYSLFNSGALGGEAHNTKALIFNVKGEDLLFLDSANSRLPQRDSDRYDRLGLPAAPFSSVAVYAPPRRSDPNGGPDVATRTTGVDTYYWTLAEFCSEELLPFVFAEPEDERHQYTMLIHHVAAILSREGRPHGDDGAWEIGGEVVRTYHELVTLIVDRLEDDSWTPKSTSMGTVNAFIRRLLSSQRAVAHLIRADFKLRPNHQVRDSQAQVTVVDLHNLHDRAKRFVVGVTVKRAFEAKEAAGVPRPLLFLVLDELNKYAPREGHSPIKEILLDVAERGRSLGVILVGAQQTASEVERRVISNSAIRVVGRLDSAEAGRPEYGFLPSIHRDRATIAKPGTMFVSQPEIPVPLVVEFPFPAWATRPSERSPSPEAPADPFEGLT
ncbi:MAG: ATP-binding protein [Acidimicrobiia bacterium]